MKASFLTLKSVDVIQGSNHLERMLMNRLTERYCCAFLHERMELESILIVKMICSWEGHHYTFSVEAIEPNWACSLVDTDMSLQWDFTYETTPQPSETAYTLTAENPALHVTTNNSNVVFLTVLPSNHHQLLIRGRHLYCVLFQAVPKSCDDYDKETPIGRYFNSRVIECDEECSVSLSDESHFRIEILDGSEVDFNLGGKKDDISPSDGVVCENCGKTISQCVFQVVSLNEYDF